MALVAGVVLFGGAGGRVNLLFLDIAAGICNVVELDGGVL